MTIGTYHPTWIAKVIIFVLHMFVLVHRSEDSDIDLFASPPSRVVGLDLLHQNAFPGEPLLDYSNNGLIRTMENTGETSDDNTMQVDFANSLLNKSSSDTSSEESIVKRLEPITDPMLSGMKPNESNISVQNTDKVQQDTSEMEKQDIEHSIEPSEVQDSRSVSPVIQLHKNSNGNQTPSYVPVFVDNSTKSIGGEDNSEQPVAINVVPVTDSEQLPSDVSSQKADGEATGNEEVGNEQVLNKGNKTDVSPLVPAEPSSPIKPVKKPYVVPEGVEVFDISE